METELIYHNLHILTEMLEYTKTKTVYLHVDSLLLSQIKGIVRRRFKFNLIVKEVSHVVVYNHVVDVVHSHVI